ncbi:hypothetical protein AB0F93_08180 [Micromonospora tulbaghiae]|uniref:hypothetical protein n=1 Tax=Micromonospora tulbaghiae TaxID=479978 RepID=UPI0033282BBD
MNEFAMVHNSRILGLFDSILHADQFRLQAVEIAGRGISAEVRCTMAALLDKGQNFDGSPESAMSRALEYSDQLLEIGDLEDDLDQLMRRRLANELGDVDFEQALDEIVARLEAWPPRSE